jgi:ABC-type hemin transport system ATPase subunit
MKPRTPGETAILCLTGLIALALVLFGLHTADANGKTVVWVVLALSLGAGMVALSRALMFKRKTQAELAGGEQYRALAEEYRRLADLAITAQEHTDLKLGEVTAQLDHLREQSNSLQKILKEVE